jgi:hypothetical protein
MWLAFVDALQKGLQNELREKDESMRIAEPIVSIAKQAVLLCKKPDTNELVSMLKADDMEFRARLTENEELRSHPLLAALFKFEVHSSMPYKWEGVMFGAWVRNNVDAGKWQEGYRRLLIDLTRCILNRRKELYIRRQMDEVVELGRKCDDERIPFLLVDSAYDTDGVSSLIQSVHLKMKRPTLVFESSFLLSFLRLSFQARFFMPFRKVHKDMPLLICNTLMS